MRRDEQGTASVMIIGFFLVALLMVVVVVNASAAYLRRQTLDAVADGAALAAALGVQGRQVYEGGLGERAKIDPVAARAYVEDYLRATGSHGRYPGLSFDLATSQDSIVVRVTAPLELPFAPPGWVSRTTVTGTAASFVVVGE